MPAASSSHSISPVHLNQSSQPSSNPTPASGAVAALASPPAPSSQLLADLVRKLASFRRGLVQERKEKKLLELSLEESLLQQAQLESQIREQDVQLMTSLELSASLEHALHQQTLLQGQGQSDGGGGGMNERARHVHTIQESDLEHIFNKPKKEMENELTRLFKELSTIQHFYHDLEKRSLSDKVAAESANLKLTRDLKSTRDQLDKRTKEVEQYKMKVQEVLADLSEVKDVNARRQSESDETERKLRSELEELRALKLQQSQRLTQLESELAESQRLNATLTSRTAELSTKVETFELTLRHFTCIRVREHGDNVTCEVSVKKVPATGEIVLTVKDHPIRGDGQIAKASVDQTPNHPTVDHAHPSQTPYSPDHPLATPLSPPLEFAHEYSQDITTVRCCAVYADDSLTLDPADSDPHLLPRVPLTSLTADGLPPPVIGFKPRFVLCFAADNHRCIIFETESVEFRRHICKTLQAFVRMVQDKHVDELGPFFGDESTTNVATSVNE